MMFTPGSATHAHEAVAGAAREGPAMPRGMRGRDVAIVVGVLSVGLLWSYMTKVYDVRMPSIRVALTALSIALSFVLFWAGLAVLGVPRGARATPALWALLGWNGVLLGQMPYLGYLLMPVEVLLSVWLLRRQVALSHLPAFVLTVLVRALVFGGISAASYMTRYHLLQ
jgi:hypothetical protein